MEVVEVTDDEIGELLTDYGAGRAKLATVVAALVGPYRQARAEKARRDPADPDAALDWSTWDSLSFAHVMGRISTAQYGEIADAVIAAARAGH